MHLKPHGKVSQAQKHVHLHNCPCSKYFVQSSRSMPVCTSRLISNTKFRNQGQKVSPWSEIDLHPESRHVSKQPYSLCGGAVFCNGSCLREVLVARRLSGCASEPGLLLGASGHTSM